MPMQINKSPAGFGSAPAPVTDTLPQQTMIGSALNADGQQATGSPQDVMNSIKGKLAVSKKMKAKPTVGFSTPAGLKATRVVKVMSSSGKKNKK